MSQPSSHTAAGTWDMVSKTAFGEQRVQVSLDIDDDELSGTMTSGSEVVPLEDCSVDGNALGFSASFQQPMPMRIMVNVNVDGDTMTGTAQAGVFPEVPTEGRRVVA